MQLTQEESDLFFELMDSLHFYANSKFKLIEDINSFAEYQDLEPSDKITVRNFIFTNLNTIDEYIDCNPDNMSAEKLSIVEGWKAAIQGEFYIERYLKNYAVFIGGEKVYAVLALRNSFEEHFPKNYLPVYVKAVLLPFKGKIIYDGIMQSYNIHFGGGMKRSIKESYMKAKQNNRIIFSLGASKSSASLDQLAPTKQSVNWSKEMRQLISLSKKLKGGADQPVINGQVFSLLRGCVELANQATQENADVDTLFKELKKVKRSVSKIENTLYRYDE